MNLTRRQLRSIIKETLAETTDLNKQLYGSLEKAIVDSKFWLEGNTEDDGDYEDVPSLGLMHQTSAAQYLQDTLQNAINNVGQVIIIAVQSPELDVNPGFLLTPDKPQYPDSVISGGYATITPDGKQAVVLNMSLFDDSFNDNDVNPQRIARKGGAILRHEIVHLQQVAARAESEGISLIDAFENFRKEPKSIPPEGAGRQQYIKSHIEIDAHAHQAADELLALYGKEEALRLISKTVDFEDLGVDLPHAVEDYLIDNPSSKTARQFRKKVYEYINSISEKVGDQLNEAIEIACEVFPEQSLPWLGCQGVTWIWAKTPHTSYFTGVTLKHTLPRALSYLGFSKAVTASAATLTSLASAGVFVIGMFAALPMMIQRRIELLDSTKGFFMNLLHQRKLLFYSTKESRYYGPLEYDNIATKNSPLAMMFGESTSDRDDIIDLIASQMGTPEGKKLYGELISTDSWAMPGIFGSKDLGKKWRGPIIGKSISSRILKRRKEIITDANKKMIDQILERTKELQDAGEYKKIIEFAQSMGWDQSKIDSTEKIE
jgi:hypothetical protein